MGEFLAKPMVVLRRRRYPRHSWGRVMADLTLRQIVAYERSSIVYPDELSDAILNRIEDDPGGRAEAALGSVARPHALISILVGTMRVASAWPTVIGEREETATPMRRGRGQRFGRLPNSWKADRQVIGSRAERFSRGVESPGRDARWGGDHHRPLPWPNEPEGQGGARDRMAALRAVAREVRRQGGEPLDHDAIRELVEVALDRGIPVNRMRIAARTMDLPLGNAVPTSMVKT